MGARLPIDDRLANDALEVLGVYEEKKMTLALSAESHQIEPLCSKVLILAPDERQPATREAWLNESEMTRLPLPTTEGMVEALVA